MPRRALLALTVYLLFLPILCIAEASANHELWYAQPATTWSEALPIGNGRLGGMVFGGVERERIQLNEDSLWSGFPQDSDNPEALEHLTEIRELLFAGNYKQAEQLAIKYMVCKGPGSDAGAGASSAFGSYQTFGDLLFTFPAGEVKDYRRSLDLARAVLTVSYVQGGVRFKREIFSSAPDQAIVIRITADQPKKVTLKVSLDRDPRRSSHTNKNDSRIDPFDDIEVKEPAVAATPFDDHTLVLSGRTASGKGMAYEARLSAAAEGGAVGTTSEGLSVTDADAASILLVANTDFVSWKNTDHKDPAALNGEQLSKAAQQDYAALLANHVAAHQKLFSRATLDLPSARSASSRLTDVRLKAVAEGENDPGFAELYFDFGRYLLICSSRPGDMPANLQGIWCDHFQAPWNCDYHHNINDQMNYWPVETCNLAELHEPFISFIDSLREPGRRTAQIQYGQKGWVVHTISNIWGFTSPGEHPSWGQFTCAGAWLCQDLWEHFAFNPDAEYLKRVYPIMKESAEFYLGFLVPDPKTGWLVTSPSNSPENHFKAADGTVASICYGPSMDMEILNNLFTNCIAAANLLNVDADFRTQLEDTRAKLAPLQTGKFGQLQEWIEDFEETEPGHRHMSHLFALHPGNQITLRGTPELAKAARISLERRMASGGGHTGWSRAWIINFWARLEDGDKAWENLQALFAKSTLPNLFDNHPPFQIDGNFGATAGIAEMLLQSHAGEISILPALPKAWGNGTVLDLRARGGHDVSITWKNNAATLVTITAGQDGPCRVRSKIALSVSTVDGPVPAESVGDGVIQFAAKKGTTYTLQP